MQEMLDIVTEMRSDFPGPNRKARRFNVNKAELCQAVADEAGVSKAEAERCVNALISNVQNTVKNGDTVTLPGFGTWKKSHRSARKGRNPRTGEIVEIKASEVPKWSAGAQFKQYVNS